MNEPENIASAPAKSYTPTAGAGPAPAATPTFADVKAILDDLTQYCDFEKMRAVHDAPNFGWDTVDQLKSVIIKPQGDFGPAYPLIDMDLINKGQGDQTNLVIALSNSTGVNFNGQMPRNPPARRYATPQEVATIVAWLNAGLPE